MKGLQELNKLLYNIVKYLIIVLLISMSALVFLQVVFRYCFSQPLAWSEEITTYMFSWLAYMGAAVVMYNNAHVSVTSVVDAIKNENVKKAILVLGQMIILVFFIVVSCSSFKLTFTFIHLDQRLTNLPFLKIGFIFLQVPLSATMMGLFTLERVINIIRPGTTPMEGGNA